MNREELRSLGAQWRVSFPEMRFLGQIAIDRDRCGELWQALGLHYLSHEREMVRQAERADLDATVAVVLANLAFYFDPADDTNNEDEQHGFISFVTAPLGWYDDRQQLWEARIGAPVRRLLEAELGYEEPEENRGAWRFVRPVLRQGGVPLKYIDRFLTWLSPLAKRFEITKHDFERHLDQARNPGTILRWFLEGPQGYELCSAVVRCLRSSDVAEQGLRPELIDKARRRFIPPKPGAVGASRGRPWFALDLRSLRLGIRIPDVPAEEYRYNGARVYGFLPLPEHSLSAIALTRKVGPAIERLEVAVPYAPSDSAWAIFAEHGGRFVSGSSQSGNVPAGRFIFAAGESVHALVADFCVENLGELEAVGADDARTVVSICDFPSAYLISAVDNLLIPTERGSPAAIQLIGTPAVDGSNIFVHTGPKVRFSSFNAESASAMRAWCSAVTSDAERPIPQPATIATDGSISYAVPAGVTARVAVWAEPRGIAPRSWIPDGMEVSFVVFAEGTTVKWPDSVLGFNDLPHLEVKGPDILLVSCNDEQLIPEKSGEYSLPFADEMVVVITTVRGLAVQITRETRRVRLRASTLEAFDSCPVLFFSDFEVDEPLELSLPERLGGTCVHIGIAQRERLVASTSVNLPRSVRKYGVFTVSTRTLRDSLESAPAGPSMVAVQIGETLVKTGVIYARTPGELLLGPSTGDREDLGLAEIRWGAVVRAFRAMHAEPAPVPIQVAAARKPLAELFVKFGVFSSLLDRDEFSTALVGDAAEFEPLRLGLLANRKQGVVSADVVQQIRKAAEDSDLYPRWRGRLRKAVAEIVERSDVPLLVRNWVRCWRNRTLDDQSVKETALYGMAGGDLLTEGARKLFMSVRSARPILLLSGANGALRCLQSAVHESSPGAPVWILAHVYLIAAAERCSERSRAERLYEDVRSHLGASWVPTAEHLDAMLSSSPHQPVDETLYTIRLSDLQPSGISLFDLTEEEDDRG